MTRFNFLPVISEEGTGSQLSNCSNILFFTKTFGDIKLGVRYFKQPGFERMIVTRFEIWISGLLVWYTTSRQEALKEFREFRLVYLDVYEDRLSIIDNQINHTVELRLDRKVDYSPGIPMKELNFNNNGKWGKIVDEGMLVDFIKYDPNRWKGPTSHTEVLAEMKERKRKNSRRIPQTINEIKKEAGEHLLNAEYWNEPY